MKLSSFLEAREITLAQMGVRIGVSAEAVRRYRDGLRYPEPDIMANIKEVTGGEVDERDFLDVAMKFAARRAERRKRPHSITQNKDGGSA